MDQIPAHRPLVGISVLDLSRYLPGPYCSLQLSWLGARVTCIEQPPLGDPLRTLPPLDVDGVSYAYRSLRRDARSELIDLSQADGLRQARALAEDADVLIESFRPGVAQRLGLGADALRSLNPKLVYCSISGYGQGGPWSQAPGHDLNYQSVAGLLGQNGFPTPPELPSVPMADLAGGLSAATAICAALVRRSLTGTGCTIDIALSEAAVSLQAMQLPGAHLPSGSERDTGMLTGGLASYHTYRCADDQWIAIAALEPKFFARLCELIDRPQLVELQYDLAAQQELHDQLAATLVTRTSTQWLDLLVGVDGGSACVTPVLHPSTIDGHPQLAARGAVEQVPGSAAVMPAAPYVLDGVRSDSKP